MLAQLSVCRARPFMFLPEFFRNKGHHIMPTIVILRMILSFLFASSILLAAVGPGAAYEPENDRLGGDIPDNPPVFKNPRESKDALSCQKDCFDSPQCQAWTFVKPGNRGFRDGQ